MTVLPPLTDHATARYDLLIAAETAGASLDEYRHPSPGPVGEPLATDVARFGAPIGAADEVVLISSGVHGVEGHAGNGLQQLLVASGRLASLPASTAVVLVHAVNPYGFAWSRRVDHQNIDVNRNFVDHAAPPDNPLYAEVDHLLNPTDDDLDPSDLSYLGGLGDFMERVGATTAFRTLSGGQYTHPAGVQFGGGHMSWSRQTLERIWSEHLTAARSVVCLDIHTALGPTGQLTVFQTADEAEPAAQLGAAVFPDTRWRADRTNPDPVDHGLLGIGLDNWAPGNMDTATFVLEFGTHDPMKVLTAFRADNWLHNHGDPRSARGREIAQCMREQMFIDDTGWRSDVADAGTAAIHTMLDTITSTG